jgi:cytochrome c oxidase subunit 4
VSESTLHSTADAAHEANVDTDHDIAHSGGDLLYVKIALLLGALTGIEVMTYFFDFGSAAVGVLLGLMVVKFAIVGLYFMHLKFDNKLFTQMFVAGVAFAVVVYCAMLATFHFW